MWKKYRKSSHIGILSIGCDKWNVTPLPSYRLSPSKDKLFEVPSGPIVPFSFLRTGRGYHKKSDEISHFRKKYVCKLWIEVEVATSTVITCLHYLILPVQAHSTLIDGEHMLLSFKALWKSASYLFPFILGPPPPSSKMETSSINHFEFVSVSLLWIETVNWAHRGPAESRFFARARATNGLGTFTGLLWKVLRGFKNISRGALGDNGH